MGVGSVRVVKSTGCKMVIEVDFQGGVLLAPPVNGGERQYLACSGHYIWGRHIHCEELLCVPLSVVGAMCASCEEISDDNYDLTLEEGILRLHRAGLDVGEICRVGGIPDLEFVKKVVASAESA